MPWASEGVPDVVGVECTTRCEWSEVSDGVHGGVAVVGPEGAGMLSDVAGVVGASLGSKGVSDLVGVVGIASCKQELDLFNCMDEGVAVGGPEGAGRLSGMEGRVTGEMGASLGSEGVSDLV